MYSSEGHGKQLKRIRDSLVLLEQLNVSVKIAWVPAHTGIMLNEMADKASKKAAEENRTNQNPIEINKSNMFKIIKKNCVKDWQRQWDISPSGRSTYELFKEVTVRVFLTNDRATSSSILRLCLNKTNLNETKALYGFSDSRECECGKDIEDRHHFLLECNKYEFLRNNLISKIFEIWEKSPRSGNLNVDVILLLGGTKWNGKINPEERKEIVKLLAGFIKSTGRKP